MLLFLYILNIIFLCIFNFFILHLFNTLLNSISLFLRVNKIEVIVSSQGDYNSIFDTNVIKYVGRMAV